MKNFFYLSLSMMVAATSMNAQSLRDVSVERAQTGAAVAIVHSGENVKQQSVDGIVTSRCTTKKGVVSKSQFDIRKQAMESRLNAHFGAPKKAAKVAPKAPSAEASFFESFEGWDGETEKWLPEGWSRVDKCQVQSISNWHADKGGGMFSATPTDGAVQMVVNNPMDSVDVPDEWIISPVFTVKEGHNLSFDLQCGPAWLFDTSKIDFSLWEFTELIPVGDVSVLIRAEGEEEWTKLWSEVDHYMAMNTKSLTDLYENASSYINYVVSMANYAGKKVQVAFRYQGAYMADNAFLDAVTVDAMPTPVSYQMPDGGMYWSLDDKFMGLTSYKVKLYPVFMPLTWQSVYGSDVTMAYWKYRTPESTDDYSMDKDLTVTYRSDYTDDFSTKINIYNNPTLYATAPGFSEGEYQDPTCDIIETGGTPGWFNKDDYLHFTVSGAPLQDNCQELTDGQGMPVFGYATENNADNFWKTQLLQGATEGDSLYVEALLTLYDAPSRSYVVDSLVVFAVAELSDNAVLKAEICPISEDGTLSDAVAEATCSGADVYRLYDKSRGETSFVFKFDKPVVVDGRIGVRVSGFRGEGFTYFNPMMSVVPRQSNAGMIMKVKTDGQEGYVFRYTDILSTSLGNLESSFYFNLYATYPYLQDVNGESETGVTLQPGVAHEVALDSYYDAEKCTVTAPEWLKAEMVGQYNEAKLTLTSALSVAEGASGEVVVECPGEKLVIPVTQGEGSGINDVTLAANGKADVYNMAGVRVRAGVEDARQAMGLATGVYVVRYENGVVTRMLVK